jgi:nicotinamidase-related amidase
MPLSTLDSRSALIVIDLQKGISGIQCVHPLAKVVEHASDLATTFRQHNLPVVLVTVTGTAPGRTEHSTSGNVFPPELVVVDGAPGLEKALAALWPDILVQRCTVHKHRNLIPHAPERLPPPRLLATTRLTHDRHCP